MSEIKYFKYRGKLYAVVPDVKATCEECSLRCVDKCQVCESNVCSDMNVHFKEVPEWIIRNGILQAKELEENAWYHGVEKDSIENLESFIKEGYAEAFKKHYEENREVILMHCKTHCDFQCKKNYRECPIINDIHNLLKD